MNARRTNARWAMLRLVVAMSAGLLAVTSAHGQVAAPDIEVNLTAAAEADRADVARRMALARSFNDMAELRRLEAGEAVGQYSELTTTLVQSMATRPDQVDGIIATA